MANRWPVLTAFICYCFARAIINILRLIKTVLVPVESILGAIFCTLYKHNTFTFSMVHTELVPVCSEQYSNDACSVKVSTVAIPSPHRVFHKVTGIMLRGKSDFDTFLYGLVYNIIH